MPESEGHFSTSQHQLVAHTLLEAVCTSIASKLLPEMKLKGEITSGLAQHERLVLRPEINEELSIQSLPQKVDNHMPTGSCTLPSTRSVAAILCQRRSELC